jgi:hypothetical protein
MPVNIVTRFSYILPFYCNVNIQIYIMLEIAMKLAFLICIVSLRKTLCE